MNRVQAAQADRLRQLHSEVMGAARMVMDKAIEAGGILLEVKAELPHGDFTAWVETNAGFSIRTAQRYMKIFEHREELKNDSVSLLTDAHKMLTAPKEEKMTNAGLTLMDALTLANHYDKYGNLHEKVLSLQREWEVVKDSKDIPTVVAFYNKAKAICTEAAELTLRAEMNLGRLLNEIKALFPTKQERDEFTGVCKILDKLIAEDPTEKEIISNGGTQEHVELFKEYKATGLNSQYVESVMQVL